MKQKMWESLKTTALTAACEALEYNDTYTMSHANMHVLAFFVNEYVYFIFFEHAISKYVVKMKTAEKNEIQFGRKINLPNYMVVHEEGELSFSYTDEDAYMRKKEETQDILKKNAITVALEKLHVIAFDDLTICVINGTFRYVIENGIVYEANSYGSEVTHEPGKITVKYY